MFGCKKVLLLVIIKLYLFTIIFFKSQISWPILNTLPFIDIVYYVQCKIYLPLYYWTGCLTFHFEVCFKWDYDIALRKIHRVPLYNFFRILMSTHNPQSVHMVVIYRNPRNSLIRDMFFIFRLHLYVVKLHEVTHNIKRYFTYVLLTVRLIFLGMLRMNYCSWPVKYGCIYKLNL